MRSGLPRRAGNYWLLDFFTSDRGCLFRSRMFTRQDGDNQSALSFTNCLSIRFAKVPFLWIAAGWTYLSLQAGECLLIGGNELD